MYLAEHRQIASLVFHVINVSAAGNNMTEKQCEEMYDKLMSGYAELNGGVFWQFQTS